MIFNAPGNSAVFCRALSIVDDQTTWGDLAELYVTIGQTNSQQGYPAPLPAERDKLGSVESPGEGQPAPDQPTEYPAPTRDDQNSAPPPAVTPALNSQASLQSEEGDVITQGTLTITGRWRFYDRNDSLTSEQLIVEIVRGDNSDHLAWCYTDVDGYYTCGPFTNPGAAGVRSRFLSFTSFSPFSDVLATVNPDWGTDGDVDNAFGTTTSTQSFSDGTHDIGWWHVNNGNNYERAYWVTQDLIRVWKYIWYGAGESQSPQESAGSGTVEWKIDSTDGTYYSRGGNIHLTGADPLSNTVVGHEFGHNIMYTIYGNWMPTTYCPSPHYVQLSSHVNCAWTEGWANFLPLAVNNDPVYRWASGGSLNLETPSWSTSNWDDGDDVEGRVAGALWDILDSVNDGDDQYSDGGLTNIWDTIYHQNDYNFSQYWSAWKSRGHNSANAVMSIYQNTIDYRISTPPAAPTIYASDGTYTSMVYISWGSVSDATSYKIYRATSSTGTKTYLGSTTNTYFYDYTATPERFYYYFATACNSAGCSGYSSYNTGYREMTTPTGVSASDGTYTDKVNITWNSVSGATYYYVYRATSATGAKSYLSSTTATSFDDASASASVTYYYFAVACNSYGCSTYSSYNTGWRAAPAGPPVDVFLLVDLSSSFNDDLPNFKAQAPTIISTLLASNNNTRFGLGRFEDYPISPFGGSSDKAYERVVDLTFNTTTVLNAISGLSTRWGNDAPESQLPALYQAATGAGQNLSAAGYAGASIAAGQQANFRSEATKLIILWTDASFHQPGDPGDIAYPGPGFAQTAAAINALGDAFVLGIYSSDAGVTATALAVNPTPSDTAPAPTGLTIQSDSSDLSRIVSATGAFAGDNGVDCDNDGLTDVAAGQPMLCPVGYSGDGVGNAVINLVQADRGPARIYIPLVVKD